MEGTRILGATELISHPGTTLFHVLVGNKFSVNEIPGRESYQLWNRSSAIFPHSVVLALPQF